jgi:Uma2 family endonuclease
MDDVTTMPQGNLLTIADLEAMPGYGVRYELINGAIYLTSRSDEPLTIADLERFPGDDGRRYELLDGVIVVTAAPSDRHQAIVKNLLVQLNAACPPDARIRPAPYDVTLGPRTRAQPDVVVARAKDITPTGLPGAPLLAVEVLSPSTRHTDLTGKKRLYAEAGCPSYWVVDPGDDETPTSLVAWELVDGTYVERGRAGGDEEWRTTTPFPVTVVPRLLVD